MVCLGHRGIPRTKYSALSKYLWDDASQRRTLVWFWLFAQKPYYFLISCDIKSSPPLAGIRGAPELGSQSNSLIFILSVLHHVLFAPTTPGNIPFPRQDLLPLSSLQVFAPSPENAWKAVQGISARPNPTYHLWISSQPSSFMKDFWKYISVICRELTICYLTFSSHKNPMGKIRLSPV